MKSDRADAVSETGGYVIDANAVADAIIARLLAGRILPRHPADDR